MRILRESSSTPLLAVVFECLFVFSFNRRMRNTMLQSQGLRRYLDMHGNSEGLRKIVQDLRNLIEKLDLEG